MVPPTNYRIDWARVDNIPARDLTCGYCGREVSASRGWLGKGAFLTASGETRAIDGNKVWVIVVCPRCSHPSLLVDDEQTPGVPFGEVVHYVPEEVDTLYDEARRCMSVRAYNAAGMLGRKILMYVAVQHGAAENLAFYKYVNYLVEEHVVTPAMKPWVDEIRELGNDAAHELPHLTREEAETLMTFAAMLLRNAYEYPEKHRASVEARASRAQQQPPAG